MRFYLLEKFINLHDGYRRTFKIDEHQLLLLQEHGEQYLIEAYVPASRASARKRLISKIIRCAAHCTITNFDLRNGRVITSTEEPCRALRRYELVMRDKDVGVML